MSEAKTKTGETVSGYLHPQLAAAARSAAAKNYMRTSQYVSLAIIEKLERDGDHPQQLSEWERLMPEIKELFEQRPEDLKAKISELVEGVA